MDSFLARMNFAALALAIPFASALANYPYLDDALNLADTPEVSGTFPKVMMTETQSIDAPDESFTKYDVVGGKAGMMEKFSRVQKINPDVQVHYEISPRAYQGFDNLEDEPCQLTNGLTFESTGTATRDCKVFSGHWLYYAGTRLAKFLDSSSRVLYVEDASRLRNEEYVVIYDAPAGSFKNAEHAQIVAIDTEQVPNKVTLAQRGFKSNAVNHASGSIIAQHALGRGRDHPENWSYNQTTLCPLDSKGKTIGDALADWLAENIGKNSRGVVPENLRIDGIYFDADDWLNTVQADRLDADNDLIGDSLMSPTGENLWGEGMELFFAQVRQRFPDLKIVGGMRRTRGFDALNGVQMEGFPVSASFDSKEINYGHSTDNDGFDSMFQRYQIHSQYHYPSPELYAENLGKSPTKLYPKQYEDVTSNAPFRLALATTLLGNGYYGEQNSWRAPDVWYDEYAVDVDLGSASYGHAVPRNSEDESAIRAHKGWLGAPLGPYVRLYDEATFHPTKTLLTNHGFEEGTDGWTFGNVETELVSSGTGQGYQSLHVIGHSTYQENYGGAWVRGPKVEITAGKEYTLSFLAKAERMREVPVRVQGPRNPYLIPENWTRVIHTFKATEIGSFRPEFNVGFEDVGFWLDAVYLFEGNANVFWREFTNGIVAVNATPSPRTIDLGGSFLRIKGTGQDPINDGSTVFSVDLDPYDAAILVRPILAASLPSLDCGMPKMQQDDQARIYIWASCNRNDRIYVRATKGDGNLSVYSGQFTTNDGPVKVYTSHFGESDQASVDTTGQQVDFLMKIWKGYDQLWMDGNANMDLCLNLNEYPGTNIYLGPDALPVSSPVNVRTGETCTP